MNMRVDHDSLGEVEVPADALYGAQTARAVRNFPFRSQRFPRAFLRALGLIKRAAAEVNGELGSLEPSRAGAIAGAASEVAEGLHDSAFVVDVYQTGSGTSTNMNANEVIATLASRRLGAVVHPNDHVNLGQSSNDVIPTAIHVSAATELNGELVPALAHLADVICDKAEEVRGVVKTGRTHLMDAVPIRMSQELGGWEAQVREAAERLRSALDPITELAIGGTAVGTGLNTHPEFGEKVAERLCEWTGLPFKVATNRFAWMASQDAALELSGQLRGAAVTLTKIANDLRWMNSGPVAGLGEIELPALQPGSSIMPGKVNPVIPEAVAMMCAQVIGYDAAIGVAALSSNFQLNVMQPLVGWNLLESIGLLSRASRALADGAIAGFRVNKDRMREIAGRNSMLATALAPRIGYEQAARIAHEAMETGRTIRDVALEKSGLAAEELDRILDAEAMTGAGE